MDPAEAGRNKLHESDRTRGAVPYLFEGLVVDKAGRVLGHLELALLDMLTKFPTQASVAVQPRLDMVALHLGRAVATGFKGRDPGSGRPAEEARWAPGVQERRQRGGNSRAGGR